MADRLSNVAAAIALDVGDLGMRSVSTCPLPATRMVAAANPAGSAPPSTCSSTISRARSKSCGKTDPARGDAAGDASNHVRRVLRLRP